MKGIGRGLPWPAPPAQSERVNACCTHAASAHGGAVASVGEQEEPARPTMMAEMQRAAQRRVVSLELQSRARELQLWAGAVSAPGVDFFIAVSPPRRCLAPLAVAVVYEVVHPESSS